MVKRFLEVAYSGNLNEFLDELDNLKNLIEPYLLKIIEEDLKDIFVSKGHTSNIGIPLQLLKTRYMSSSSSNLFYLDCYVQKADESNLFVRFPSLDEFQISEVELVSILKVHSKKWEFPKETFIFDDTKPFYNLSITNKNNLIQKFKNDLTKGVE